jgi:hypothetical protein
MIANAAPAAMAARMSFVPYCIHGSNVIAACGVMHALGRLGRALLDVPNDVIRARRFGGAN